MLTVNVSDFVVQEIIEQLWACYVMKYGEHDAQLAEKNFYDFRQQSNSSSLVRTPSPMLDVFDEHCGAHDVKRQYMKRYSTLAASQATGASEPLARSTNDQNQQV
jgi:hypothetical protein